MSASILDMSMSLDGYIADPDDFLGGENGELLHDWFAAGGPAAQFEAEWNAAGAVLTGRRTAELMDHWGGDHDGAPIFVPSHRPPGPAARWNYPLVTYVTDGIESAMAQAKAAAGDRDVQVRGGYVAQRAIEAGVLDEVQIHHIPADTIPLSPASSSALRTPDLAGGILVGVERVVVFGCAGSGKSTLSRELATCTGLPLTERDALGVPGSRDYREALGELARQPLWILDGAPYYEDDLIYGAADTVIFLDYPKLLVMWRVLRRTLLVELFRRPVGAHRPGGLGAWRDSEHPLRWAWSSHQARRQEGLALIARPDLADADVIHFTRPAQASRWMGQLRACNRVSRSVGKNSPGKENPRSASS